MHGATGRLRWFGIGIMIAPMLLALCTAMTVAAATRQVAPGGADSGDCTGSPCATITYAIGQAADSDAISVAAGTYHQHDIQVTKSVTITGAGAATTTIDGDYAGRVVLIPAGKTVGISSLTIQHGYPGYGFNGGGILNQGTLTITSATITANYIISLYVNPSTSTRSYGGGIYNDSGATLTVNSSAISGNAAGAAPTFTAYGGSGGGIYNLGAVTIQNSTFDSNGAKHGLASEGLGGAIDSPNSASGAPVIITNTTMTNNLADDGGSVISTGLFSSFSQPTNGPITLDHVTMSGNADGDYAIDIHAPLTITNSSLSGSRPCTDCQGLGGAGIFVATGPLIMRDTTVSDNRGGSSNFEGLGVALTGATNGAPSEITRSTITVNHSASPNPYLGAVGGLSIGGIGGTQVAITDSHITGNTGFVGGIYLEDSAQVTMTNSTVTGNIALDLQNIDGAGGIRVRGPNIGRDSTTYALTLVNSTVSGNSGGTNTGGSVAGGISTSGAIKISGSTVSGNTINGDPSHSDAGGILAKIPTTGGLPPPATTTFINSTVSGNTGGGVNNAGVQPIALTNVTVANNDNGVTMSGSGAVTLKNSLLKNTNYNCSGAMTTGGYNLDSGSACFLAGGTDILNGVPNLGPLQVNAPGTTATHALLPGSQAIDRIPNTGGCNGAGLTTDQRGVSRPQPAGGLCDVGAYEAAPSAPPMPTNLHVTGATYNSLTWSWAESDATAPLIYTVDGVHFYGLAAGTTTFTLYGIAYGSYACISIAAYNANGASGYTPYSCSYVQPIAPYNPHQTAGTTSTGTISWANYDTLSYEQVYDYAGAAWHQVGVNGTSYTLTGIPAGYYHCAAVQAYNVNYASGYSYACPFATPNAPTNIHATSVSSTQVTFAWDAPDPYSWYYVYETSPSVGHVVTGTQFTTTHIIVSGQHGYACIYVGAGGYGGTSATFPYACAWAY